MSEFSYQGCEKQGDGGLSGSASEKVANAAELPAVKAKTKATLDGLIKLIEADARQRAES